MTSHKNAGIGWRELDSVSAENEFFYVDRNGGPVTKTNIILPSIELGSDIR